MAIRYDLDMTNHLALDCDTAAVLHRHTMRWAAVDARLRRERLAGAPVALRLDAPPQADKPATLELDLGFEHGEAFAGSDEADDDSFVVVLEAR
jgi:hypothetical protein